METRFLDSLLVVIDCGSIAEAARRLNLTAAGVAQRIRTLEDEFGVPLVMRAGRTVRPTAAATGILAQARAVQRNLLDLKAIVATGTLVGEFRLGVTPTLLSGIVPDLLSSFAKAHPKIDVRIVRNNSRELYAKLMQGEVDAALTSHPAFEIPKTCQWVLLRQEPYILVAPDSLAARSSLQILNEEPFIRLDRTVYAGQAIDAYLRKMRIQPKERFEMDGPEAIAVMVDRGLGFSILPDWAPPWPEGLRIKKLPLPGRKFFRKIGLIWQRASLRSGLITAFLNNAVATMR